MASSVIPKRLKSDHLFLLIGENPLPNYVAALLQSEIGGTVYLLHSTGEQISKDKIILSTKQIAGFIKKAIKNRREDLKVVLRGISEVDSKEISAQMKQIIEEEKPSGRIGLNYTGGRKPMAIHAYQAIKHKFEGAVFSYLDANHLELRFDDIPNPYPVSTGLKIKLGELANLHAYQLPKYRQTPELLKIVHAIAETHSSIEGIKEWKAWLWENKAKSLPNRKGYPALEPVIETLDQLYGGKATPAWVARKLGHAKLESCYHWFNGTWLEELALNAIIENKDNYRINIHDYGIGLEPKPSPALVTTHHKKFELDVAAMIGYQLFVVSCISSKKEGGETKKHLFEAYTRARQLGGDEARVALVCLVENPSSLLNEIKRDWHTNNQVKVFGRKNLLDLKQAFYDWFRTAN